MTNRRSLKVTAALSVVLFTAGCATSGGKGSAGGQQANADNSTEYAATGGLLGAAIGCGIGALANKKNRGAGCMAGGAVGALAGAGTGLYYAKNQGDAAAVRGGVAADQERINEDLQKARQLTAAAQQLVNETHTEIEGLKQRVAVGQASRQQLAQRIMRANQDRVSLEAGAEKLRTKIQQVEFDIGKGAYAQADVNRLKRASEVLRSELAKIDQSIRILDGDVSTAGV